MAKADRGCPSLTGAQQRNTDGERVVFKSGVSAKEIWPQEVATSARKDPDASRTLNIWGKVRPRPRRCAADRDRQPGAWLRQHLVRPALCLHEVRPRPPLVAACSTMSLIGRTPAARSAPMRTAHGGTMLGLAIAFHQRYDRRAMPIATGRQWCLVVDPLQGREYLRH